MHHEIQPSRRPRHHKPETDAILVRPVSPGDEEGLGEMLSRLSQESICLRFHAPYPRLPGWAAASFADANRPDGESLAAVADGEIVGHAMYVRQGAEEAEFAVVVEDRWQARGVGKRLLRALAVRATDQGAETFTGEVLGENRRMLALAAAVFAETTYTIKGGVYHVRMPLRTLEPIAYAARTLGRAA